jgi:hypothetical protein
VILLLLGGGTLALSEHTAEAAPRVAVSSQQFDLKVVALVDYLLLPAGLGCDYGQGSATLVVSQSAANVSLSVQGDVAKRAYTVVMITNEGNFSIGTMAIDGGGNGTFSGGAKLGVSPTARLSSLSEVAIRLYYTGQVPAGCFSLDLVGLPFPVIISSPVTTTSTTSRTTTTSTTTSTSHVGPTVSTSSSQSTSSTQKPTTTTSTATTVSATTITATTGANVSTGLTFKLVSLPAWLLLPEPLNYPFQSGTASVIVDGNTLHVDITIAGSADTAFIVDLHANDQNITLGTVSTTAGGTGDLAAQTHLDNGTYLIGIRVYQAARATAVMATSSLVGVSIPLAEPVVIGSGATTTTTPTTTTSSTTAPPSTTTQTSTQSSNQPQNNFSYFSLNLVKITAAPEAYLRGSGTVDMDVLSGVLDVSVQLDHANPDTKYTVVLLLGKSNVTLGSFVTNSAGNAQLDAQVPVGAGTYATSVLVYDDSSFHSPTLVMTGVSTEVSITSVSSSSTTVPTQTKPAIITAGASAISTAETNGTIPAEVQISSSGQQLDIIDHSFSVSVGRVSNSGVAITVSGQNVTGPRTFLIDVNGSMAQSITSGSFEILFDGQQISEASSLSAVLSPQPGAPATYAVVQTSSGVELLVSVPHFSTHVIEILGVSFQSVKSILEVSLPVLLGAMVVLTLIFGAIYASRRRV